MSNLAIAGGNAAFIDPAKIGRAAQVFPFRQGEGTGHWLSSTGGLYADFAD